MPIKYEFLFLWMIISGMLNGCGSDEYTKTQSGLEYKFIRNTPGEGFLNNQIVYLNISFYDENDSLLFTYKKNDVPVTMAYNDFMWENGGQVYEGLSMMDVGDSAILKVNARNLYEKSFQVGIPPGIDPESIITFYVGVEKIASPEEFRSWQAKVNKEQQKKFENIRKEKLLEDISIIDYYLEEAGIIPMELESGIRYVVHRHGKGPTPQEGDQVEIHYSGKLLDGTEFDNSYDRNKTFKFVTGNDNVIEGWQKGVSIMQKGGKYTFYIPSIFTRGARDPGEIIRQGSILVYDIELIDIQRKE